MALTLDKARGTAYLAVAAGVLLSLVSAFEPHAPGAYKLSWAHFIWALLPYVFYSGFTILDRPWMVLLPAPLILGTDLYVHLHGWFLDPGLRTTVFFLWLPLWLTVVALPAGLILGRGLGGAGQSTEGPAAGD